MQTNKTPQNWLAAHLSADLPYDINQTIADIPGEGGSGKEEWYEALAVGIREATYISEKRMEELFKNDTIIEHSRPVDALAERRELTEAQAFHIIWLSVARPENMGWFIASHNALHSIAANTGLELEAHNAGDPGPFKEKVVAETGIDLGARRTAEKMLKVRGEWRPIKVGIVVDA